MSDSDQSETDVSRRDLSERFELTLNLATGVNPDIHLEGLMATIRSYRDFIVRNLQQAAGIDGPAFVRWMESATRDPDDFPEPWAAEVIEMFDGILIHAVRDENMTPGAAAEALDEWVEQSTREAIAIHDLPEDFFDV